MKFASSNDFPRSILTSMINDNHTDDDNDIIKFYFGRAGEMSIKNCIRALKKNIKKMSELHLQ